MTKRRPIRMKIRTGTGIEEPPADSEGEQAPVEEPRPSSRCRRVSVNRATGTSIVRRGACAGAGAEDVTVVVTATSSAAASGPPRLAEVRSPQPQARS